MKLVGPFFGTDGEKENHPRNRVLFVETGRDPTRSPDSRRGVEGGSNTNQGGINRTSRTSIQAGWVGVGRKGGRGGNQSHTLPCELSRYEG